jgi:predicted permease
MGAHDGGHRACPEDGVTGMWWRDLRLRARALFAPRNADRDLQDELAFHVEMETRKHAAAGLSTDDAHRRARARFGSMSMAADQCRDARGTAALDDIVRDTRYALRSFIRAPFAALTIVGTVALGLGVVAVVFTIFNVLMFRVDAVRDPGELFAVVRPGDNFGESARFARPEYEALRRETNVFSDVFAMLPDIDSRIDGRMMSGTLVTGNFFQALGVDAALGRALTPGDDQPASGRPVMVLSHKGWSRRFENAPDVVGRKVVVNGFPYVIVGVMPEDFRGLGVGAPDYWAPLSLLGHVRPIHRGHEESVGIDVVGRLKPGLSRQTALAGLAVWASGRTNGNTGARARAAIGLEPRQGTLPKPAEALLLFTPLFFVFGLILAIGCANVANLLMARAVSRQREMGIRLALGASRARIVRQLLTESLLLACAAAVLGFVVSRIALEATVHAVTSTLAPEIAEFVRVATPAADWRVAAFLAGGAIVSTVFFGLAPALQATRLQLTRTIRGEVTSDPRPNRARHALIGAQVTASALLLICSAVFLRGSLAASSADPGFRTDNTVAIEIVNEPFRDAMVRAVAAEPTVAEVSAQSPDLLSRPRTALAATVGNSAKSTMAYRFVSPEYFSVLGIDVLRGRTFTQAERTPDSAVVVVSDSVARQLWSRAEAVGQVVHLEDPTLASRTFTVVGVVRDVPGFRFPDVHLAPGVYLPTNSAIEKTSLTVRVHGDPEQARRALLQRLTTIDPNMGQVMTLRTVASMQAYVLQIAFWVTAILGCLALVLTLSGLFSVLSYLVEQRKKEISVRMALGATTKNIARMVLSQSARPVGFGLLAGAGLAWGVARLLLATAGSATIDRIVHVLDPVAYAASVLLIVFACVAAAGLPAWRAARINPSVTLRQD